jgi:hypothetical protein
VDIINLLWEVIKKQRHAVMNKNKFLAENEKKQYGRKNGFMQVKKCILFQHFMVFYHGKEKCYTGKKWG